MCPGHMADTEDDQEAAMAVDGGEQGQEGFNVRLPGEGERGRLQVQIAIMEATSSVFPVQFSSFPAASRPLSIPPAAPSVFPVVGNMGTKQGPDETQSWLSNSSFSKGLLLPPSTFPVNKAIEHLYGQESLAAVEKIEEIRREPLGARNARGAESLTSISDSDISEEGREGEKVELGRAHRKQKEKWRRKQKKKEERRKRKELKQTGDDREIGSLEGHSLDRKTSVKIWAEGKEKTSKEYYFDSRGDKDNFAFGSLYRMDVPRYNRQQSEAGADLEETRKRKASSLDVPESDGAVQEKVNFRYWSWGAVALEKRRDFKRIRIHPNQPLRNTNRMSECYEAFIPVGMVEGDKEGEGEGEGEGESWDDCVTRRTREFNTITRERPMDESAWLAFSNFQDELIQAAQKKGVKQQAIEKKIAVLEKALEIHGDSEELTLIYLQACSLRDTVAEMQNKWQNSVARFSGSYRFWKAFLMFWCSQFSLFSVSSIRSVYIRALRALTGVRDRLLHGRNKEVDEDDHLIGDAECAIVAILADRCRFELQTGHAELALGIYQAAIEYSLFDPLIQPNESNKRRLFEAFWDSQARRVGEEGALGWAAWLEREEENIQISRNREAQISEERPGGWTGWSERVVNVNNKNIDGGGDGENTKEPSSSEGDEDDNAEGMDVEEDEATLLRKLGLSSIDAGKELEVTHVGVWKRWAVEEKLRGSEQWCPVHAQTGSDEDRDEQLERMVVFEDIRDTLVSITSEFGLRQLIGHFLAFCNTPLPHWCSSNELSFQHELEGVESLTSSLGAVFGWQSPHQRMVDRQPCSAKGHEGDSGETVLRSLVGDREWFLESTGQTEFVCNVLLLLRTSVKVLPKSHWGLAEMLLTVQGFASDSGVKASRALAKKLLKAQRQDIALWAAYANVEGAAGPIETARKVFDTTLASLLALPKELQDDTPLLYLSYVDMEVSYGSKNRALHILCYFGTGMLYNLSSSSVDDPVPPTLIVKARLGFQQHLQNVRKARTYVQGADFSGRGTSRYGGALDERGVAMVACVALFEELSSGYQGAVSVFEESLAFTLPGKRQQSKDCEALMERYIRLMERGRPDGRASQVRRTVLRGVVEYPYNAALLGSYVHTTSATYSLRRFFDDFSRRNPSTVLWMFALASELGKERVSNGARIRSLFERALETKATEHSVLLWRTYLAYEFDVNHNVDATRRIYFRAIHACPWSKMLWLDGFTRLSSILTAKELSEFQEIMRDKELRLRTDVYEILLEDVDTEVLS